MLFDFHYDYVLPIISATTAFVCFVFIFLYHNGSIGTKNADRVVLLAYFACAFICWLGWLFFRLDPVGFRYGSAFYYSLNLLTTLLFYCVVYRLTAEPGARISSYHYAIAAFVIIFMISLDLWHAVARHNGMEYRVENLLSKIKTLIKYSYKSFYIVLSLYRIVKYRENMLRKINSERKGDMQTVAIMCLFTAILWLIPVGGEEPNGFAPSLIMLGAFFSMWKYIYLTYKWAHGWAAAGSLLYGYLSRNRTDNTGGKNVRSREKTRKRKFEYYMDTRKPFLNPRLRIEDVARDMNTNRTYISSFINDTYGMNFSAYMNLMRIREFDRLCAMPENKSLNKHDLSIKAGFGSYRNSTRVRKLLKGSGE